MDFLKKIFDTALTAWQALTPASQISLAMIVACAAVVLAVLS